MTSPMKTMARWGIFFLLTALAVAETPLPPLCLAARAGDRAQVDALLKAGADVNVPGEEGLTPLHEAAKAGHADVVRLLLFRRADTGATDLYRCTPLFYAAEGGHLVIVNLLFNRGAEVNVRANDYRAGNSPLHEAARARQNALALVELMLGKGADIGARNDYGETALDYAIWNGNRDVAELLLARAVDRTLSAGAEIAMQAGLAAAQAEDFLAAIRHFEAARRASPDSPLPRFYLGQAEAKIPGRELRAICWFRAYLAAVPRAPERRAIMNEIAGLEARSTAMLFELLGALTAAAEALPLPDPSAPEDPDGSFRDNACAKVAILWGRAGDKAKALACAALVTNAALRSSVEAKIAEAVAEAGDVAGGRALAARAAATAAKSPRRDRRDVALAGAAITLAHLGDEAGARAIAARIEDAWNQSNALAATATAQARAGQPDVALAIATQIPVHYFRSTAQAALARIAAEEGDRDSAVRALQLARESLASVVANGANIHNLSWPNITAARATPLDRLGRPVFPPPPPPTTVSQLNEQPHDVVSLHVDLFITGGLLGEFDRTTAWQYRVFNNLTPLIKLARARARLGDHAGAAAIFDYLNGPGPWSSETKRGWDPPVNVMLARILDLQGDRVGAAYRLGLARTAAEKIENETWRRDALESVSAAANGWIHANEEILNEPVFLQLSDHLRTLPQTSVWAAFSALADTVAAVADAQRTVATMRPRPILP